MTSTTFHKPTGPTSAGPCVAAHLSYVAIPSDPGAALAFAIYHDRRADLLLSQGRAAQAEAAAHLAFEARTRVSEVRA